jgi:hypothetical protein
MNSPVTLTQLDQIGWSIEHSGIGKVPNQLLLQIAEDAKRLGVRPVAASVLANSDDPAVARERAFGLIAPSLAKTYLPDTPGRLS